MDDYRPIITQEEWEQFIQEFGLEQELKYDDADDFFQRLENDTFDGVHW